MDAVQAHALNEILMDTYNNILSFEQSAMSGTRLGEITNNEVHTIATIGAMKNGSMRDVAQALGITQGTLTAAVDRLQRKGFVERLRSDNDKRCIRLELTHEGKLVERLHQRFHREFTATIAREFSDIESEILLRAFTQLNKLIFRLEERG